jgi:hypothetical protein
MADDDYVWPDGRANAQYLEDLRRFVDADAAGKPPPADELRRAPIVRGWHLRRLEKQIFQIWGFFEGHPSCQIQKLSGMVKPRRQRFPAFRVQKTTGTLRRKVE